MNPTRTLTFRTLLLVVTLGLSLTMGPPWAEGRAARANVLSFNITPVAGDTVFSDGLTDPNGFQYADYRVSAFPPEPPVCVGAENTAGGFVFIGLNRAIGVPLGNNNGPRCSAVGGTARNWIIEVADAEACEKLWNYDRDRVDLDLDQTGDTFSPCRLNGADNPRLRFANLYASRLPAMTPIAFLVSSFTPPSGHGGYEIRSEADAVVQGNSTERFISHSGTARLWEFIGKAKPVAAPFPLKVTASFKKVAVSQ